MMREAVAEDAGAIAKVQVDTWRSAYHKIVPSDFLNTLSYKQRSEYWHNILSREGVKRIVLVAEAQENGVVGFCICGVNRDKDSGFDLELFAIYVLDKHQNQGVGRSLFEICKRWALDVGMSSMIVWVLRDNPYRRFYEVLGGELVSERMISLGDADLPEVAYGWRPLT